MRVLMAKPANEATILPAGVYGAYHRYNDTYFFVVGDGEKSVDTLTKEWKEGVSNGTIEISRGTCEELTRRYSLYDHGKQQWRKEAVFDLISVNDI